MHSLNIDQVYWYLRFFLCLGASAKVLMWVGKALIGKLDDRTTEVVSKVFKDVATEMLRYFNAQLMIRDDNISNLNRKLGEHGMRIAVVEQKITSIAVAGTSLAAVSLYPTRPPSARERDRLIDEWHRVLDQTDFKKEGD